MQVENVCELLKTSVDAVIGAYVCARLCVVVVLADLLLCSQSQHNECFDDVNRADELRC